MRRRSLFVAVACLLGIALAPLPAATDPGRSAAILRLLDRYMDALNALDLETHVATYHFPHFRLADGELSVWATPEEAMPILNVSAETRRQRLRAMLHPEWHKSIWTKRDIVGESPAKVHVATRFARLREDGSEIISYDSLYILTLQDGQWGIQGRSSFAP